MATKRNIKKSGKGISKNQSKGRRAISRKETKRAKAKAESLDKDGSSLTDVFSHDASVKLKGSSIKASTLENKSLKRDWEKDQKIREKSEQQKEKMASSLEKQIESISGFSL